MKKAPYVATLIALTLLAGWYFSAAFASESVPKEAVQERGYSTVEIHGKSAALTFSGCSKLDVVQWTVSATDSAGRKANFIVCGSAFKEPSVVLAR